MSILVSNIQGFSLQDGPGIRTVVFLMGCGLRCPWCANPENMSMCRRPFVVASKCRAEQGSCSFNPECVVLADAPLCLDEEHLKLCPIGALRVYGEYYEPQDLFERIMRDKPFYDDGGGVTWSGGEPLLQAVQIEPVMESLAQAGIDQCAESSLFVSPECLSIALNYINRMIVDVKILDKKRCQDILGGSIEQYRENIDRVFKTCSDVTLRFPVVPGMTDSDENIEAVADLIEAYHPALVEIFSVHNLAETKYFSLKLPFRRFEPVSMERLEAIRERFSERGQRVHICRL